MTASTLGWWGGEPIRPWQIVTSACGCWPEFHFTVEIRRPDGRLVGSGSAMFGAWDVFGMPVDAEPSWQQCPLVAMVEACSEALRVFPRKKSAEVAA